MVRIYGIDGEVSTVQLLLAQMDTEDALTEIASWLANTHLVTIKHNFYINVELEGGKKFKISVEEKI